MYAFAQSFDLGTGVLGSSSWEMLKALRGHLQVPEGSAPLCLETQAIFCHKGFFFLSNNL